MDDFDTRFEFIFNIGSHICACYSGLSKFEVQYCLLKVNWIPLLQFLLSDDTYEALIHFSLHSIVDVVGYLQLFIGCMLLFPNEQHNQRIDNLIEIIDTLSAFDDALTNSRMIRALLAISAKYTKSSPYRCFRLFYNSKRVLAHTFKKFPNYFDLNILRSNKKSKHLRFKREEIDMFF